MVFRKTENNGFPHSFTHLSIWLLQSLPHVLCHMFINTLHNLWFFDNRLKLSFLPNFMHAIPLFNDLCFLFGAVWCDLKYILLYIMYRFRTCQWADECRSHWENTSLSWQCMRFVNIGWVNWSISQWRHNGEMVSQTNKNTHEQVDCLLHNLFKTKKTSRQRIIGPEVSDPSG